MYGANITLVKKIIDKTQQLASFKDNEKIFFNEKSFQNMTLLYRYSCVVSERGIPFNQGIFKLLLSHGASLAEQNGIYQDTPLHVVYRYINTPSNQNRRNRGEKVFKFLMQDKYKNNVKEALLIADIHGMTPLHVALYENANSAVVESILDLVESSGTVFKAIFKNDVINHGAKFDDFDYITPLHLALKYKLNKSVIDRLIKLGAEPVDKDDPFFAAKSAPKEASEIPVGQPQIPTVEKPDEVESAGEKIDQQPPLQTATGSRSLGYPNKYVNKTTLMIGVPLVIGGILYTLKKMVEAKKISKEAAGALVTGFTGGAAAGLIFKKITEGND